MHSDSLYQDPLEVLRISTVVDLNPRTVQHCPLEVLRISTVVDCSEKTVTIVPLEVLRISTVVDPDAFGAYMDLWKC